MLSKAIKNYISNKKNFELKQATDEAIAELLHLSRQEILKLIADNSKKYQIPKEASHMPRKINKGNNHKGYPFMVSDFPCVFSADHVFSFRIMVWYGQSITISLMLSGRFQEDYIIPKPLIKVGNYQMMKSRSLWSDSYQNEARYLDEYNIKDTEQKPSNSLQLFRQIDIGRVSDLPELTKNCFVDLLQL